MCIRSTRFQVRPDSIGRFQELVESAKQKTAPLDGLRQSYFAMDDSGKGVMLGIWESREKALSSLPAVKAAWAEVMEHLAGQPQIDEYSNAAQVKG